MRSLIVNNNNDKTQIRIKKKLYIQNNNIKQVGIDPQILC